MNKLLLVLVSTLLATAASADVPVGGFRGQSPALRNPDIMALVMRRDAGDPRKGYAVLSEYTRVPYIGMLGAERLEITRWVPRMYIYRVEQTGERTFRFIPLRVSGGALQGDPAYPVFGTLTMARGGSDIRGAVLTRYDKGGTSPAETITFDGHVSSTWQDWVSAEFFASHDATGGDYFHKRVNTVLRPDHTALLAQPDITGEYQFTETVPGIWLATARGPQATGQSLMETRIGVFIDIVNWKPFFRTNELLMINPDDARDVGFYYQRH